MACTHMCVSVCVYSVRNYNIVNTDHVAMTIDSFHLKLLGNFGSFSLVTCVKETLYRISEYHF